LRIALDGAAPDRVPCALGFYQLDVASLAPARPDGESWVEIEFVRFPPSPEERRLGAQAQPDGGDTRLGNPYQRATYESWQYRPEDVARRNPLAHARSLDELAAFPFPDATRPYRPAGLDRQVRALHARGIAAGGNLPHLGGELFEAAWRLRGLENFLIDLARRPAWAELLLDRLTALARRNAETLARAGIDVLSLDDDVGMPGTMIIGPDMWRRFFKPRYAEILRAARAIRPELRALYHSDGWFEPIVGDLAEIGFDAINPLQPEHMDAASVRRRFGTRPALWGTVGRQTSFSFGTPADIRREVAERLRTLGRAGLVLCPAYDIDEPDIPRENVVAFLEAVRELG